MQVAEEDNLMVHVTQIEFEQPSCILDHTSEKRRPWKGHWSLDNKAILLFDVKRRK